MASCEKCWDDAYIKSRFNGISQPENYSELIKIQNCTAEQQAGIDAKICPICKRRTIHQIINECMNPECMNEKN